MNPNGNKNIGGTKKYGPFVRQKISRIIRKEWDAVKSNPPSADEFGELALNALKKAGIVSPDGTALNLRGVKYQVQRTGIKFKGRVSKMRRMGVLPTSRPKPVAPIETKEERSEIIKSLSSIPVALRGVLTDESLSPKQRTAMFEAYFELNK